jgi:hypothetical protein
MDEKKRLDWPQWSVAVGTILLAIATFVTVYQNNKNILLTKAMVEKTEYDSYLKWRPDIYCEIATEINSISQAELTQRENILSKAQSGEMQEFGIELPVVWGNSGGSPAILITRSPTVNGIKAPIADTMTYRPSTGFSLWPQQKHYDVIQFNIANHAPTDDLYLHIPTWYKDRKGKEYWFETVFYMKFEKGKLIRWNIIDGVYEGEVKK